MRKRTRQKKVPPKRKKAKLETIFDCPFCEFEKNVNCTIEREINIGTVSCRICGVKYSTRINHLGEEIDVYYKWIDACEEANHGHAARMSEAPGPVGVKDKTPMNLIEDGDDED